MELNNWDEGIRRNFWLVRVVEPWNNLPDSIKQQETVNGFKNVVDNFHGWGSQRQRYIT